MTQQITTIPSQPFENQNFFLNFNNPNLVPASNTTYVLKNTNGQNVSSNFINPINGLINGTSVAGLESCSYLVKDSQNNYYFTNNKNFAVYPDSYGTYYIYKLTINPDNTPGTPTIFINDPVLINTNPIGLAIDSSDNIYVALQSTNVIRKYNSDGTNGIDFISGGSLNRPCGMAFDSSGNLYIANRAGNNILKYNSSGVLQYTITNASFGQLCALGINSLGELYVSDLATYKIFQILLPSYTVTEILTTTDRESVNMTFDINNNIILPSFNDNLLYFVTYGTWSYTTQSIMSSEYRLGGIILNKFGDAVIIQTSNPSTNIRGTQKFLTYWFNNINLPAGYNSLILYNVNTNSIVTQFTVFIQSNNPNPNPNPNPNSNTGTICFKEGTKILCKLNGKEVYIPVETIEEGTLVKTYKNGYKKCKFNMRELLKNTEEHSINNLYRQSRLSNKDLFEDLYITGSHSMLYNNLNEKEDEAMYKLLAAYNSKFNIEIPSMIEDKYKLIAYYDNNFIEVRQNINVYIYHLVLESDNKNRNYGIWANGLLSESIDEFTLINHLHNNDIKLVNIAKRNNNVLLNTSINKLNINYKPLGTKLMNKMTKFK